MAYDYSREWLDRHSAEIKQVIEAYEQDNILYWSSPDPTIIRNQRYKINNLLRSLTHHRPDLYELRQRMRTWIVYDKDSGNWIVHLGKPKRALPGTKPGKASSLAVPVAETVVAKSNILNFPKAVDLEDDSSKLFIEALNRLTTELSIGGMVVPFTERFLTSPDGWDPEQIADIAGAHDLRAERLGPHTFQFTRKEAE
jgi:hypothetical protein